jgi:hypothetical protein
MEQVKTVQALSWNEKQNWKPLAKMHHSLVSLDMNQGWTEMHVQVDYWHLQPGPHPYHMAYLLDMKLG